ncbi:unnamed protein product, partial [Mesorhabditis belari]|uniref:RRM domain-containing protein n=1 Tax=Mesorhabditis belari TaxID=2138241 RepID=A0AAF3JBT3_9BILA
MSSYYDNGYQGGYGNSGGGGSGGYNRPSHHRINEEDVPESKHTVFIRGLPGNMPTDEVKEYFDERIGPCSFDFTKVSADRSRLFVAVRFESREHAKECMNRYKDADVLGYPCELTWFRDIRRFASYQAAQQGVRGGAALANRGRRGNMYRPNAGRYDRGSYYERKRRHSSDESSRSRSRSRSGSGSSRRSRSASRRSSSRERVIQSQDESKRRKKQKKTKKEKKRRSATLSSASDGELRSESGKGSRSPRQPRSPARSPQKEALVVSHDRSDSPLRVREVKAAPNEKDGIQISIKVPSSVPLPPMPPPPVQSQAGKEVHNTTISFGLEGDQPPKKVIRKPSTPPAKEEEMDIPTPPAPAPALAPAPAPVRAPAPAPAEPQVITINPRFKPIGERPLNGGYVSASQKLVEIPPRSPSPPPPPPKVLPIPPKPVPPSPRVIQTPPQPTSKATRDAPSLPSTPQQQTPTVTKRNEIQIASNFSTPISTPITPVAPSPAFQPRQLQKRASEVKPVMKDDKYPNTATLLEGVKEFQTIIIEQIKYEPPEEEESGTLKLSSLSTMEEDNDENEEMKSFEREQKLASLTTLQRDKVELKKKQLEKAFKNDCETYKIVTLKLLSKDGDLEKGLRLAMMQVFEDLEKQMLEKLDVFLTQV